MADEGKAGEDPPAGGREDGLLKGLVDLATDWKVVVTAIAAGTSVFFSFEERDRKRLEINQEAIGYVRQPATLDRFWSDPANTINEIQASYPQHAFCATLGVFLAESTRAEIAETAGTGWDRQIAAGALRASREALYEETARIAGELSYPLCLLEEKARAAAAKSVPLEEGVDPALVTPPDERPECRPPDEDVPAGCAAIRASTSTYWRQLASDECLLALDAYGENVCLAELALRRHVNIVAQERGQPGAAAIPLAMESGGGAAAEAAAAEAEVGLDALLAAADPEAGERAFRACSACHKVEEGANAIGPHLWGVVGREIGSVEGYGYSAALSALDGAWDAEALSGYLANPKGWAPGTTMAYAGLRDSEDRADVIAYLNEADGTPEPLPAESGPASGPAETASGDDTETGGEADDDREPSVSAVPPPPPPPPPEPEAVGALPAGPGDACAGGSPLVYAHVTRPEDADWIDSAFDELRAIGWDITRPDPQPKARTEGDVRFYWPEQEACAAALARDVAYVVGAPPGQALKTISLAGTYKNLPHGRMELWLPPL